MPAPELSVIVHGGFHKTATSHIQGILRRNAGHLERRGLRYAHHRETRRDFTVPVQLNGYFHLGIPRRRRIDDAALRALTGAFFQRMAAGAPGRLLISDENLAGHCGHCVRGGELYAFRAEFMQTFAREIPHPVAEVHLAVRGHAEFFAAAYVEFLRSLRRDSRPARFVTEAEMKRDVLARLPSWAEALADVRAAFPAARIFVWRYEDYAAVAGRVLQNLCGAGVDAAKLRAPGGGDRRPTASGEAVARMLKAHAGGGIAALVERRIAIQRAYPRGPDWGRYDPWEPAERAALDAAYARDWDRIRADGRYAIVAPEPAEAG